MKKRFLFYFLIGSLVLISACQKETSQEGGAGPSDGTLQDGGTGDCLPKTVSGTYVIGTALSGTTNYIEVEVDVTTVGRYTIYTDTVNGIYFRATGIFTTAGLNTVKLPGAGTPLAGGIHNFIVSYGSSGCSIAVTTASSLGAFTFDGAPNACTGANPNGSYVVGVALTTANTVNISIVVTALGSYSVSTLAANGMTFVSSGIFTTLGAQSIDLTGSGTPVAAGSTNVPITAPGGSNCSFTVPVAPPAAPAAFLVICSSATVNGVYTANTALTSANTVTLPVNVTGLGPYNITASIGGMTFAAASTFTTMGAQNVVLNGTGTPTVVGVNTVNITQGTTPCSFTVTVLPGGGPVTAFATDCGSAVPNGTYTKGVALVAATNTITIDVNVTVAGPYSITTTAINGMTFSKTGTFAATGVQTITLAGSGTPTLDGSFNVAVPAASGGPCNFTVIVDPAPLGTWSFKEGATTFSGIFDDAELDNTSVPGLLILYASGPTTAGHYFELDLGDVSGAIANGETYNCAASLPTQNPGIFYFEGPPPTSPVLYLADPGTLPNTLVYTITTHNTTTKTVTGTFAGTAQDENGAVKTISQGVFTFTYP